MAECSLAERFSKSAVLFSSGMTGVCTGGYPPNFIYRSGFKQIPDDVYVSMYRHIYKVPLCRYGRIQILRIRYYGQMQSCSKSYVDSIT